MENEQREIRRKPIDIEAYLSCKEKSPRPCRVRDLSLNGAFVECEDVRLTENETVEFGLSVGSGENKWRHCVPARIVRVSKNGAALSFRKIDMDAFGSLLKLLYVR